MLDIKFIRENVDGLKVAIKQKHIDLDLDQLLKFDSQRLEILQQIEKLNARKNELNEMMKIPNADKEKIIAEGKEVKEKILALEPQLAEVTDKYDALMVKVPVIPSPDTPVGEDDKENVVFYEWGEKKQFDFEPKDHIEIGKKLDIMDIERGAKVGGYRGYYLKNEGVLLVMGLMQYVVSKMVQKGYMPMIPPTLVKEYVLFGSGYFKGTQYNDEIDEVYQVSSRDKEVDGSYSKDRKFLVGTAEPSLLAYYSGEVLQESQLPMRICGYSQCYRSEIGSYGKDTKGHYRVHEFMKVEQVVLAPADIELADKLQQEMVGISKEIHEDLGLPYRQLRICTGDMSAGKYKMFDIEAWLPGMNRYGETGSASNFVDWQSRRLNVKYQDKDGNKKYVYMLNNTALPSPRAFIAILENYQQSDGSVIVPEVLRKYVGKDIIKAK